MNNKDKIVKVVGWLLFLFGLLFFSLQMGYLFVQDRYQVEYIDHRLFYLINIASIICLALAIIILLQLTKKSKIIGSVTVVVFIVVHIFMLFSSNQEIKNITSISPNGKHILSIKENVESGEAYYYRNYCGILARPKEKLPFDTKGEFKIKWLAKDIAAVTYKTKDDVIQQFIGTYGDRGDAIAYYDVGAEIQGSWQGDNIEVETGLEGISVTEKGETTVYEWDYVQQYGTLAIVLKEHNEAAWTISLNENFEVYSGAPQPTVGNISIYEATMEENEPITLSKY